MAEHIWVKPMGSLDIGVSQFGEEDCEKGHSYGPAVRDHFLLHFILSGKGVFSESGVDYALCEGEGFLIRPEEIASYKASEEDPWRYFWIGFSGKSASRLMGELGLEKTPIFTFHETASVHSAFDRMCRLPNTTLQGQLALTAELYGLLSRVFPAKGAALPSPRRFGLGQHYVERAIEYIRENYQANVTVAGLAEYLRLNRCYISDLFRRHTKVSPLQFLISTRMSKAAALLKEGRLTVTEVAKSVGYEDPLLFSRMFRKQYGTAPREYRKDFAEE